ncbi:hypothetical protein RHMOL_Rhmol07G0111400 [Rhododendron molle]|uniref:Uncharacterized protein n=1 Tax=Rhododendron molle TaxID=49168 RepID=A0ACC0MZE7_RHOML|nr:hypothetical protein RHMOL_Rhmol07G0111400 [Rhododendron molle]
MDQRRPELLRDRERDLPHLRSKVYGESDVIVSRSDVTRGGGNGGDEEEEEELVCKAVERSYTRTRGPHRSHRIGTLPARPIKVAIGLDPYLARICRLNIYGPSLAVVKAAATTRQGGGPNSVGAVVYDTESGGEVEGNEKEKEEGKRFTESHLEVIIALIDEKATKLNQRQDLVSSFWERINLLKLIFPGYSFIVTILAFIYSAYQLFKGVSDIAYKGILISDMASDYFSFILDQFTSSLEAFGLGIRIPPACFQFRFTWPC